MVRWTLTVTEPKPVVVPFMKSGAPGHFPSDIDRMLRGNEWFQALVLDFRRFEGTAY